MQCRPGCGACCIAPSISETIPGMPEGKPAGLRCVQLDEHNYCQIFSQSDRPKTCGQFQAERSFCGETRQQALKCLAELEQLSQPD